MIQVDLITGFLGSGKTTFITEYADYLVSIGKKVAIIVNDYGAINVDRLLLEEKLGDKCHLEMVIGGDPDCSRRRLKTKLIAMAMNRYDYVIVEPSGIFDVDDFFDLIFEEPLERWYQIGDVISIVDASIADTKLTDMSVATRYLLASQVSKAGRVVISKMGPSDRSQELLQIINECLEEFKCTRRLDKCFVWNKGEVTADEWNVLRGVSYYSGEMIKLPVSEENDFTSLFFFHVKTRVDKLEETVSSLFKEFGSSSGNLIRLKGFLPDTSGGWIEVNATKNEINISSSSVGQELFILIGENLKEEEIGKYWDDYKNQP